MKKKSRPLNLSNSSRFTSFIQNFDSFGDVVTFQVNGRQKVTSSCGGIISILILLMVISYTVNKCQILIERGDANHSSYLSTDSGDLNATFNLNEMGLNFAFGINNR